jgi:hypothetical protein
MTAFKEIRIGNYFLRFWPSDNGWMCGITPQMMEALEQPEQTEVAWRKDASEYERGFIDGMQKQMQSSVDKAVNAMSQRTWVGLTDEEIITAYETSGHKQAIRPQDVFAVAALARAVEAKLKEKNT